MKTSDEQLDDLLSQARWAEPTLEQEYHLRQRWQTMNRRRRLMPLVWSAAAAAIVLIIAGAALIALQSYPAVGPSKEKYLTVVPDEPPQKDKSRPATAYERLALMQATHSRPERRIAQPVAPANPVDSPALAELRLQVQDQSPIVRHQAMQAMLASGDGAGVVAYLNCLSNPSLHEQALAALKTSPKSPREALLGELNNPVVAIRLAAAQALGAICDAELTDRLGRMVQAKVNRREALAALLAARDSSAVAMLDRVARDEPAIGAQIRALEIEFKFRQKEPGHANDVFYRPVDPDDVGRWWTRVFPGAWPAAAV